MFKVSSGNSKLGKIYNINLPAGITCAPNAPCRKEGCYAMKGTFRFPSVKNCYAENLATFQRDQFQAEQDILLQLPHIENTYTTLYCRIHSSGDFVDMNYLKMIVSIAKKRPYMKFLAFTKKYDLINAYLDEFEFFPSNLKIVFSHWTNYPMNNKYNLPIAMVQEHSELHTQGYNCSGTCETCYHCWHMVKWNVVIFHKH